MYGKEYYCIFVYSKNFLDSTSSSTTSSLQQLRVYYIQSMCDVETFANGTIIIIKIMYNSRLYT